MDDLLNLFRSLLRDSFSCYLGKCSLTNFSKSSFIAISEKYKYLNDDAVWFACHTVSTCIYKIYVSVSTLSVQKATIASIVSFRVPVPALCYRYTTAIQPRPRAEHKSRHKQFVLVNHFPTTRDDGLAGSRFLVMFPKT